MSLKSGKVETFDPARGEGVIRLAHDRGAIPVRFSAEVCRGVVPAPGVAVLAGWLGADPGSGGPLSDTFAMRAGLVEADRGVGDLEEITYTMGLAAQRPGSRPGTLLVPFDEACFPQLATAFPEELMGALAFGPPVPSKSVLPPQLRLLSGLLAISRRAFRFRVVEGTPREGATFAGGAVADLGDRPWPKGKKGPALPVLQVGLEDARRLGLEAQINVFADVKNLSSLQIMMGPPGGRATIAKSLGEAACLEFVDEVLVFPEIRGIEAAWDATGQPPPIDVGRFWDVQVVPTSAAAGETQSIQADIGEHLPRVSAIDADFVLGGFAERGGDGARRLATFFAPLFPWLKPLEDPRGALEVTLGEGDEAPEATLSGVWGSLRGFELDLSES